MASVLTCYYKPKPGGFCKRLFMSINALLEAGHDVHYLAVAEFPIHHPSCHFHKFPWPVKYTDNLVFWLFFFLLSPLFLIFISFKYRINSCYAFNTAYGFLLQPVRILKGIPLSIFLRADVIENHRLKERSVVILAIETVVEGLSLFHANVYGVSKTLTDDVIKRHKYLHPLKYGELVNNIMPVDVDITAKSKATYNKPLRLVCAGILEARKNQMLLLHMLKKINRSDVILYLFGSGSEEKKLRDVVNQLKIDKQVKFMGWVDSDIIWEYADVLLTPSLHEGAPNIVLEALAYNIPILASNLPEHREILPASSLLPIDDVSVWANKIAQIIDNPVHTIKDIKAAQAPFADSLIFDWGKAIVDLISPDHL